MNDEFRDYINLYRKLGFSIIPVRYKEKIPSINWTEYQTRQPTDKEIERWFFSGTQYNIGIVCGSVSNLVVMDFDNINTYYKVFGGHQELEKNTIVVKSSENKRHVYVRTDNGTVINSTKIMDSGFEVHSERTIVVAPPSIHPKGHVYKFINDNRKLLTQHGTEWVKNFKKKAEPLLPDVYTPPCIEMILKKGVREGIRDEVAIRIASYLKRKRLSKEKAIEVLLDWNGRNRPSLEPNMILDKVNQEWKKDYFYSCEKLREISDFANFCNKSNCKSKVKTDETPKANITNEKDELSIFIMENTDKVVCFPGEPSYFCITIKGKTGKFKTSDLLGPKFFRIWFYETFKKFIFIKASEWGNLMDFWGKMVDEREYDDITDEKYNVEEILNYITSAIVVDNIEETLLDESRAYIDNNVLLIPTKSINKIIQREKLKISLRKLRFLLDDYLVESSKIKRVDEKLIRFWCFDLTKVRKNQQLIISFTEDTVEDAEKDTKTGGLF